MVATQILLTERAEALERLRDTLAGLEGAASEAVLETAERAGASGGRGQVGQDYMTAQFLAEISQVLAHQQERIRELESAARRSAKPAKGSAKK